MIKCIRRFKTAWRQLVWILADRYLPNSSPRREFSKGVQCLLEGPLQTKKNKFGSAWRSAAIAWFLTKKESCTWSARLAPHTFSEKYLIASFKRNSYSFLRIADIFVCPQKLSRCWLAASLFFYLLCVAGPISAQTSLSIDPTQRSGDSPAFPPLERPSAEGESLKSPAPLTIPGDRDVLLEGGPQVLVDEIRIVRTMSLYPKAGKIEESDVRFGDETELEIKKFVSDYSKKKPLSLADLQNFRQELTLLIANPENTETGGYVNSGAVILDSSFKDGVATMYIVGGKIDDIHVTTKGSLSLIPAPLFGELYVRPRLQRGSEPPFNVHLLRKQLQRLLQNPNINRMNTVIQPSPRLGEASLDVTVEEKMPLFVFFEFDNFQNPSVGAERGRATVGHNNFFGLGDAVSFTYGRSDGTNPLIDVAYTLPFTPWDTTFQFRWRKNDTMVVENPFDPLNIELDSDVYSGTLRQPFYFNLFNLDHEVALSAGFEHLRNQNSLLGQGFPFFAGATSNGKQVISALRFGQEWLNRGRWEEEFPNVRPVHVVSFRSRLSWGVDAFGATINSGNVPSGRFFSWLGQLQGALRLEPFPSGSPFNPIQILSRVDLQLADRDIFPLEEYAIGGRFTVRGYRENTFVRDNAFFASLELRVPLVSNAYGQPYIQVAPFFDVGRSWNVDQSPPTNPKTLASAGLGLLFFVPKMEGTTLQAYWGGRLKSVDNPHNNTLQDYGFHVQFTVQALPFPEIISELF